MKKRRKPVADIFLGGFGMELMDIQRRWIPKVGEAYFVVSLEAQEVRVYGPWYRTENEPDSWFLLNTFRTKKEAQEAAKKITKILRGCA